MPPAPSVLGCPHDLRLSAKHFTCHRHFSRRHPLRSPRTPGRSKSKALGKPPQTVHRASLVCTLQLQISCCRRRRIRNAPRWWITAPRPQEEEDEGDEEQDVHARSSPLVNYTLLSSILLAMSVLQVVFCWLLSSVSYSDLVVYSLYIGIPTRMIDPTECEDALRSGAGATRKGLTTCTRTEHEWASPNDELILLPNRPPPLPPHRGRAPGGYACTESATAAFTAALPYIMSHNIIHLNSSFYLHV